jgi:hypothetical protein
MKQFPFWYFGVELKDCAKLVFAMSKKASDQLRPVPEAFNV